MTITLTQDHLKLAFWMLQPVLYVIGARRMWVSLCKQEALRRYPGNDNEDNNDPRPLENLGPLEIFGLSLVWPLVLICKLRFPLKRIKDYVLDLLDGGLERVVSTIDHSTQRKIDQYKVKQHALVMGETGHTIYACISRTKNRVSPFYANQKQGRFYADKQCNFQVGQILWVKEPWTSMPRYDIRLYGVDGIKRPEESMTQKDALTWIKILSLRPAVLDEVKYIYESVEKPIDA